MELHRHTLAAAALAAGTILLTRHEPALAAVLTVAATLAALRGLAWPSGLAALPVLLAALPRPPVDAAPLPAGPVRVDGLIAAVRRDPRRDEVAAWLATRGGRVWLHLPATADVLPGDRITAIARSSPASVPGEAGSLRAGPGAWDVACAGPSLPRACAIARRALELRIQALAPGEPGLLLTTLVLGSGTALPADLAAAHRATGLSHLLAVSGAHAAMLAALLGLQPFGGGRRRPVGRRHLWAAMLLLAAYGAITGMEPPVFRALCSYGLVAIGLQCGRRVDAASGLLWPALVSAVVAPAGALGPSFCLSYAAVVGLVLAGGPRDHGRRERWLLAPLRASAWATLATAPLTLFWFGQLAPWTIVLTPLLAPLVGAMLFFGLGAAMLTLAVPAATAPLGAVLVAAAELYIDAVDWTDGLPWTPVFAPSLPPLPLLLAFAGLGAGLFALRRSRSTAALAFALAAVPHFLPVGATAPGLRLFAVGHGQACLCTLADGCSLLIDCGSQQHASLPARKVTAVLRRRRIDWLVLTHSDRDHCGAVLELLRRVPVGSAVLPAAMAAGELHAALVAHGADVHVLAPGTAWTPRADVTITAPAPAVRSDNDESLWVRVRWPSGCLLATGDAEAAGVRAALTAGIAEPADLLLLPHHGRRNELGDALLAAVRPRACLVSDQQGGDPAELAAIALRQGIPTFSTASAGDLEVRTDAGLRLVLPSGVRLAARR